MAKPLPMPEYLTCYIIIYSIGSKIHMMCNPDLTSNGAWLSENEAYQHILFERLKSEAGGTSNIRYEVYQIEWPMVSR